jgi:hypothetical protein
MRSCTQLSCEPNGWFVVFLRVTRLRASEARSPYIHESGVCRQPTPASVHTSGVTRRTVTKTAASEKETCATEREKAIHWNRRSGGGGGKSKNCWTNRWCRIAASCANNRQPLQLPVLDDDAAKYGRKPPANGPCPKRGIWTLRRHRAGQALVEL